MEIVNIGSTYRIYDESLKTFDRLPTQSYVARFDKMSGFYLEKYADIEVSEKIYGVHEEKVQKVLNSFQNFERSLGVILSGNKGIGKSLFAKLLSIEAIKRDMPLIVVDSYIPGIASFLETIEQEVMILFDEFEKTYGHFKTDEIDPQVELLTLFDGISQGKKLFVITCNQMRDLNEYLINRPGRFHYHFRFDYPNAEEIQEYLSDHLEEKYYKEIPGVISFAQKVALNYDCLRAIAYELNTGLSFADAIKDLNIINLRAESYMPILHLKNGETLCTSGFKDIDMFTPRPESFWVGTEDNHWLVNVAFDISNIEFDTHTGNSILKAENLEVRYTKDEDVESEVERYKSIGVDHMSFMKKRDRNYHYLI